ncbi:MAG: hypothetical protein KBB64_10295, partial [Bacteroidia bacterium]|nr:hypothetical protein [Bacteroidia bacterium]
SSNTNLNIFQTGLFPEFRADLQCSSLIFTFSPDAEMVMLRQVFFRILLFPGKRGGFLASIKM